MEGQEMQETLVIELDNKITNFNGSEAWESVSLREPLYHEVSDFYKEAKKSSEHDAMAFLIGKVSGVDKIAITKMPIRKFREAQKFMLDFLNYFPTKDAGGN